MCSGQSSGWGGNRLDNIKRFFVVVVVVVVFCHKQSKKTQTGLAGEDSCLQQVVEMFW